MKLRVEHITRYHYDAPVKYALQQLKLTPKDRPGQQHIVDWAIDIEGGAQQLHYTDHHGNGVDLIAVDNPNPALLQVGSDHSLLRLEVESVVVADATGAESVGIAALLAARPDPFSSMETCWLRHIDSDHHDVVARLASKLPAPLRCGRVRPLGLDRYGVRLRVEGEDGDHDVRLPFARPVDDVHGLSQAIRILMGCPFVNGLRARRF